MACIPWPKFNSPPPALETKHPNHWTNQPWDFFGRNDAKAETPVLWPPHAKSWLIGKDSDAGRDWGQEEKGTTEDEMAGWHHWLDGRESEWTLAVGDGQGGLVCCNSWGRKELDMTERLKWTELNHWTTREVPLQEFFSSLFGSFTFSLHVTKSFYFCTCSSWISTLQKRSTFNDLYINFN